MFLRWLETRVPETEEGIRVEKATGRAPRGLNAAAITQARAAHLDGGAHMDSSVRRLVLHKHIALCIGGVLSGFRLCEALFGRLMDRQ